MNRIGYIFYRSFTTFLGWLPFSALYRLSNGVAFLLYHIIGYRKSVVLSQLKSCFPEFSEDEIKKIARDSYYNLSDIILESFKTGEMSADEMRRRYRIVNPEVVERLATGHQGIIGIASHCNNWEWGSISLAQNLTPGLYGLYKPIANPYIDQYVKDIREEAGTEMISIRHTRELFETAPSRDMIYMFVADQSPSNMREAIWIDFLGRDTACLHGPEKYQEQTNFPVVYFHVYRVRRGFYEVKCSEIDTGTSTSLTEQFMALLEQDIRNEPASWLWTHKRWKRRKEEAIEQLRKIEERKKHQTQSS